jgi:signal peptidase I
MDCPETHTVDMPPFGSTLDTDGTPKRSGGRRSHGAGETAVWLLTLALTVILACLALVYFSPGFGLLGVVSESMVPAINAGDMVLTGPAGGPLGREIKEGTIVSFQAGEAVVTHRVVAVSGDVLRTKGDAVADSDVEPIPKSAVVGVYMLRIPKMGHVAAFAQTKPGFFLTILAPSLVVLAFLCRSLWQALRDVKKEGKTIDP